MGAHPGRLDVCRPLPARRWKLNSPPAATWPPGGLSMQGGRWWAGWTPSFVENGNSDGGGRAGHRRLLRMGAVTVGAGWTPPLVEDENSDT